MPIRPEPVRYFCDPCKHGWIWAPASDALIKPPGICPRCGGRAGRAETGWLARHLSWPLKDLLSRRKQR